jgi:catechol 2,3-dioxygenase-like lactoylglutathione lyase family enzyme
LIDAERVDFIAVPTLDQERSVRFYGETLGLPRPFAGPGRNNLLLHRRYAP